MQILQGFIASRDTLCVGSRTKGGLVPLMRTCVNLLYQVQPSRAVKYVPANVLGRLVGPISGVELPG